jgi:uroporphyrinogen III methyltransferase/synthase
MIALAGKRIVITRARAQAAGLGRKLADAGAQPIFLPAIEIAPMDDYEALDRALRCLANYQWLVFTSANGVEHFWAHLSDGRLPALKVAAIGPATARALEKRGVQPALVPDEYVAEAVAAGLGEVTGLWFLWPRAEAAREALADELGRRGAIVHEIPVYRTLPAAPDPAGLSELRRGVDAITFASASAARNFAALAADGAAAAVEKAAIACIGPVTARAAREAGLRVDVVAATYTTEGLVAALAEHFARNGYTPEEVV